MFQHYTATQHRYDTAPDRASRNAWPWPQIPTALTCAHAFFANVGCSLGAIFSDAVLLKAIGGQNGSAVDKKSHVPYAAKVLLFPILLLYRLKKNDRDHSAQVCLGVHPKSSMQRALITTVRIPSYGSQSRSARGCNPDAFFGGRIKFHKSFTLCPTSAIHEHLGR